ncbi:MAG: phosphatidate cytidylyltransferase [bacterium]|nr:phosphatidate cytidylyltransferase [bacterium]
MSEQGDQSEKPAPGSQGNWSDLTQRLVSAVVLASIVLFITWSGPLPFALLLTFAGAIMCWEWANLVRSGDVDELMILHIIAVVVSAALAGLGQYSVALLVLIVGPAVKFAMAGDGKARGLAISLLGVPYIGLPLISLIWFRSDTEYGWYLIIYLFIVVWSVDIFAYFSGRRFGGPKLAPNISPKKTWSGFIGGVTAGTIAGAIFGWFLGLHTLVFIVIVSLLLGAFSQMGDLFESVIKRKYKVKDASKLIPGHGGLLDRVDGLLFAAVLAAAITLLMSTSQLPKVLILMGAE